MSILLCYDGSDSAKHALSVAKATLGDQPLTLLHVWSAPPHVLADAFSAHDSPAGLSDAELERVAFERAQDIVDEGTSRARELGFVAQARVVRGDGDLGQTILDFAEEMDAEMVVIGTRGTTAVASEPLGSVSNVVVHRTKRPVLVVPAAHRA